MVSASHVVRLGWRRKKSRQQQQILEKIRMKAALKITWLAESNQGLMADLSWNSHRRKWNVVAFNATGTHGIDENGQGVGRPANEKDDEGPEDLLPSHSPRYGS
nr:hypothetical protein BaRGS_004592 [Batillaria attramentaria]